MAMDASDVSTGFQMLELVRIEFSGKEQNDLTAGTCVVSG